MSAKNWASVLILVASLGGMGYILLTGEPKLATGVADGSYSNPCCDRLVLKNGQMSIKDQYVSYVVERDKVGPYVLPEHLVTVRAGHNLEIDRAATPLKLRLDSAERPRQIAILGEGANYIFQQQSANGH